MSELPKEVAVIFECNPEIKRLMPNPLLVNDSELLASLTQQFNKNLGGTRSGELHRITFKKDSSRELMTIQSKELAGLLTTTVVERGRLDSVAELKVLPALFDGAILPSLLSLAVFRLLRKELSYISRIGEEKGNHQPQVDRARFERITKVIVDCFECIPLVSIDSALRDIHLARLIRSNDECYELFVSERCSFQKLLSGWPAGYYVYYQSNQYYNPQQLDVRLFLDRQIMQHPVFLLFESLVAGRICEVLLSGNYSELNIHRQRRSLGKAINELRSCLDDVFRTLENGSEQLKKEMDNRDITRREYDEIKVFLQQHDAGRELLESRLSAALDQKLDGLDLLERITWKEKIELYLVNGALVINDDYVEDRSRVE
ncbi:hypothetical protein [Pseudomonas pharyngis]|uniref:hypothetical protein n=1 Tax=Pseudomonas pharyngis TaxID=2892333 RepID=UPI001F45B3B9|nr:hypothetical protein [Pseudomonas pharyngis]